MVRVDLVGTRLQRLRAAKMFHFLSGDYKAYKQASKDFAKVAVKNPKKLRALQQTSTPTITVPLFSSQGLNMLKIWVLEKFRIKTPEEKALKKLAQKNKQAQTNFSNKIIKNLESLR